VHGTFTEVARPGRLGMTWFWEGEVVDPPREHVVVELAPRREGMVDGTLVTVTHEVATAAAADAYREGWTFVLGNLATYLGGGRGGEVTEEDLRHLRRCVQLAAQAVEAGDEPFGSVLVGPEGEVLLEDHNHVAGGDRTQHPELALARWAAEHLSPEERAAATVYTSGEHCPMCAAAHGWVGLGRIVLATSVGQLGNWLRELGVPAGPVSPLPITAVVPSAVVDGPVPELADEVRALHERCHRQG
jgi:tRNA(Arg) A34 adenosine deaminase TadA